MSDDPAALLRAYDAQLRAQVADILPPGVTVDHDGPITRTTGYGPGGWVAYHDLDGLEGPALDDLIARQIAYFADRGLGFEWKLHGHDLPVDLPDRLRAVGFVPSEQETVVIAPIDRLPLESPAPAGVVVRQLAEPEDYQRIADLEAAVWGEEDTRGWIDSLTAERNADPNGVTILLAVAGDVAVSAGWIRFPSRTEFGTLWGGSTLPGWRGRGIYRSLVAERAALAAARGRRYLEVDASNDSRPILVRLGFIPVTTTTPYIWRPAG